VLGSVAHSFLVSPVSSDATTYNPSLAFSSVAHKSFLIFHLSQRMPSINFMLPEDVKLLKLRCTYISLHRVSCNQSSLTFFFSPQSAHLLFITDKIVSMYKCGFA